MIPEHLEHFCLFEKQPCPNACQSAVAVAENEKAEAEDPHANVQRIERRFLPQHLESFNGECAHRKIRCPSDLSGRRVQILPQGKDETTLSRDDRRSIVGIQHLVTSLVSRLLLEPQPAPALASTSPLELFQSYRRRWLESQLQSWKVKCTNLEQNLASVIHTVMILQYRPEDGLHFVHGLPFDEGHTSSGSPRWISLSHVGELVAVVDDSNWKCDWIHHHALLSSHLKSECQLRLVLCSLGCHQRLPSHALSTHENTQCHFRKVHCPHAGTKSRYIFIEIYIHRDIFRYDIQKHSDRYSGIFRNIQKQDIHRNIHRNIHRDTQRYSKTHL